MPPFVQSAHWLNLVRQAGRLLTRVGAKQKPPAPAAGRVQQVIRHIRHTFPSLSTPAHQLEHAYAYAPLPRQSAYTRAQQLHQARRPFTQAARGFRTATNTRRPTVPAPCNVGLGTARNYAYAAGSSSSSAVSVNVPHVLRALASLLDSDLEKMPSGSVYTPVDIKRLARVAIKVSSQSRLRSRSDKSGEATIRAFEHYFHPAPAPASRAIAADRSGLLVPSQLVTEGVNTTLTIPLAATYHSIFELPPDEPYAGSDLGVRKFANLLGGVLSLHQIIHNRASHFVIPLMDKLDSLGVTDPATCEMHISCVDQEHEYQLPESISLKFIDRSAEDVRRLLGESLRSAQEGEWWVLTEHHLNREIELSPAEARAMLEQWDTDSRPAALDTSRLVMPLIDVDAPPAWQSPVNGVNNAWPDSDVSTPGSLLDDSPDPAASIYTSSCDSLSSSLFAEMLSSGLERTVTRSSMGDDVRSDEAQAQAEREWQEV